MPNRHGQSDDYRYGFNGMESDDEVRNTKGASYDFGARMLDPRIGRFFIPDPLEHIFTSQSTYVYAANMPIIATDKNGEGPFIVIQSKHVSDKAKEAIKKYTSGEISYVQLNNRLKEFTHLAFKNNESIEYAKRKYAEANLGEMHDGIRLTLNADGSYSDSPDVAYIPGGEEYPASTFVKLIEENSDGKWVQAIYEIVDPEIKQQYEGMLVTSIIMNTNKVSGLKKEIASIQSTINRMELAQEMRNSSSGGSSPSGGTRGHKTDKSDAYAEMGNFFSSLGRASRISAKKNELNKVQNELNKVQDNIDNSKKELIKSLSRKSGVQKRGGATPSSISLPSKE